MENILVHFERNDLISLIKERFSLDEVRMDDTFKYDLLLDSLDVVELVCDVECKIGEVIPENVVDSLRLLVMYGVTFRLVKRNCLVKC